MQLNDIPKLDTRIAANRIRLRRLQMNEMRRKQMKGNQMATQPVLNPGNYTYSGARPYTPGVFYPTSETPFQALDPTAILNKSVAPETKQAFKLLSMPGLIMGAILLYFLFRKK